MRTEGGSAQPSVPARTGSARSSWAEFWGTPLHLRAYLTVVAVAAVALPIALTAPVETPHSTEWMTVTALIAASVLNVEVSRWLSGGLALAQQPHKALSAWAFACAMLLPTWWLLVVVPVTYAHARWRGIRVPLWKWIGSGFYLVLAAVVAAVIRAASLGSEANWSHGDGHHGFLTMVAAIAAFLALETLFFFGSAYLNDASDEVWLRDLLRSRTFYFTEAGVLLLGGLFALVWAAGFWFTLFLIPIYVLIQHAVLLAPLRERAAVVEELAGKNYELAVLNEQLGIKNRELDEAGQFKSDLMGMLGHEIGNPLTAVLGYAQIGVEAAETDDTATMTRALSVIDRKARHAADVLAEIVQLVASERGTLNATPESVLLSHCLVTATSELPLAERPAIACPDGLEAHVQPGHLHQILTNLLSNAAKYGGGATLVSATTGAEGRVTITVVDEGPGVPAAFTGHLFERYRRDQDAATKVPGTGIGLFISRELARANGGDLVHVPGAERGSRFVLDLPRA